ncbi:MAG: MFS transporter, partial [Candidatus Micrarchaeota archaeon]|nr:MFS transporter [Candidatus Micrarchaeota archaeon]
ALVNTDYPVALKLGGLSEASIFFIYLASISIQGVIFYYYGKLTENSDKRTISRGVLLLRATSYVFMGLSLLFVKGPFFFIDNLLLYVIGAGIAYGIYYPTTYLIFFGTIRKSNKGATLGTYSAVVGAGTLFGALASGIISVSYGFSAAFMSAGALMLVCIYVFAILPRK